MRFKRRDVRDDGMVFKGYRKYKGEIKENWTTQEMLDKDILRLRLSSAKWSRNNPEKAKARKKEWAEKNPESLKAASKKWRQGNPGDPGKSREASKKWAARNPEKVKARHKAWRDKRKAEGRSVIEDPIRKMAQAARVRVRKGLCKSKDRSTPEYIGCSWEELSRHLESQFTEGMSWDNYGLYGWHVDHIVPICSANSLEKLLPLLHFSNLQPLWAKDNLSKGGKV